MIWAVPFVVLPGVIVGASTGRFLLLEVMSGLCVIGLIVAIVRDRRKRCYYVMEEERIVLVRNEERRVVEMEDVVDASLVDRAGARAYLRDWIDVGTEALTKAERIDRFTHYCTVDIGLTSLTLGMGRNLIDQMPISKSDLLLLRLRTGEDLILSPAHVQEMIEAIGRRKIRGSSAQL
ncbi:MAG: hypothetical protein KDC00_11445 [Flavobacteriales bacterium]|nr:hypothetical protein [Flavobacteriales bacterium]